MHHLMHKVIGKQVIKILMKIFEVSTFRATFMLMHGMNYRSSSVDPGRLSSTLINGTEAYLPIG
jgi:hypothetical protein